MEAVHDIRGHFTRVPLLGIQSEAMEPSIKKGTQVSVDRFYYARNPLQRWQVVCIILSGHETDLIPDKMMHRTPDGVERVFARPVFPYVKRVIGLPGETIQFRESGVLCNGEPLSVPRDLERCYGGFEGASKYKFGGEAYRIDPDKVFVLSDNVSLGIDSRQMGAIPLKCVLGYVVL